MQRAAHDRQEADAEEVLLAHHPTRLVEGDHDGPYVREMGRRRGLAEGGTRHAAEESTERQAHGKIKRSGTVSG